MPAHRLFTADDVGHAFGRRLLFRGVTFRLESGQTLAITGRNGAGKSTLVKVLAGLLTPRRGRVALTLDGQPVAPARQPFHCGLVAPYLHVYDALTARENLAFVCATRGAAPPGALADALAFVGLAGREDDPVASFSSGMKQRVKYAAAFVTAPDVLLLDEPSANLDRAGLDVVERLRTWQQARGGLVVVATNDAAEAAWGDVRVEVGAVGW